MADRHFLLRYIVTRPEVALQRP